MTRDSGPLTPREQEVWDLMGQGLTLIEIADQMGISVKTVEAHRANIMLKKDCPGSRRLYRLAMRESILRELQG